MKNMKQMLGVVGMVALLAGCCTDHRSAGGMGNDSDVQYGAGDIKSPPNAPEPPATGANGSINRGNPFGIGPGNTL